jgi:hypothetical protein
MSTPKQLQAAAQPNGDGYQVTDARDGSRKVYRCPAKEAASEPVPNGAGSFHDPKHHQRLMDRVEACLQPDGKTP